MRCDAVRRRGEEVVIALARALALALAFAFGRKLLTIMSISQS